MMIEIENILDSENYFDDIDGVIFDLDDTLYSEKKYVQSGYKAIAKEFPNVENMEAKLWDVFRHGGQAIDEVLKAENIFTEVNKFKALKIYRFHKPEITLYSGTFEMIERIKKKGKKTGIITDGRSEGQHAKLKVLHIVNLVDEIIITDELGGPEFRKPNERAFRLMQERFNIPFNAMAYIGDNKKKDFTASESLGMSSIYFKNTDGLYF